MIVLDVGANKGEFSEHVLRHNTDALVFAFEPNTGICEGSLKKILKEFPDRLQVKFVALGSRTGTAILYGSRLMNGQLGSLIPLNSESEGWDRHSEILRGERSASELETVKMLAIRDLGDLLDQEAIDFIKIDTQGTDVSILAEFLKYFKIKSGVVEVDAFYFSEGSRYKTSENRI